MRSFPQLYGREGVDRKPGYEGGCQSGQFGRRKKEHLFAIQLLKPGTKVLECVTPIPAQVGFNRNCSY